MDPDNLVRVRILVEMTYDYAAAAAVSASDNNCSLEVICIIYTRLLQLRLAFSTLLNNQLSSIPSMAGFRG